MIPNLLGLILRLGALPSADIQQRGIQNIRCPTAYPTCNTRRHLTADIGFQPKVWILAHQMVEQRGPGWVLLMLRGCG